MQASGRPRRWWRARATATTWRARASRAPSSSFAVIGSRAYDWLLWLNRYVNAGRRLFGLPYWSLAAFLKHKVKNAVEFIGRYEEVARLLTGNPHADADDAIRWTRQLAASFRIPSLATYGITRGDFPTLVASAGNASSMKANPIGLTSVELTAILEAAL